MEFFIQIYNCDEKRFRVFINSSNSILFKKFNEVSRNPKTVNKFTLVIESVKLGISNRKQFNWEGKCEYGDIYAIKVDSHRFYSVFLNIEGYRNLYLCRYGRKQSNKNDKTLNSIISSINKIEIQKFFKDE